jgi:hypothetical protein
MREIYSGFFAMAAIAVAASVRVFDAAFAGVLPVTVRSYRGFLGAGRPPAWSFCQRCSRKDPIVTMPVVR